jgi:type IV pilus assembly protein PilE
MRSAPSRSYSRRRRTSAGFSLIELAITIAVLTIIVAVAVPSYADYVRRSARTEVQALITTAATRQSQFLVDRRRYADSLTVLNLSLPTSLQDKYTVSVAAVDGPPPTFTITATAKGNQAKDKCPTLTLDQAGDRSPSSCW